MKTPKNLIFLKTNLINFYQRAISFKVVLWKVLFVMGFVISLFWNFKQDKVIKYYEKEYAFFDSLATVHIKEIDSLKRLNKSLNKKEMVFKLVTTNIAKEQQMLYERPEEFADLYFKGQHMHWGGGE